MKRPLSILTLSAALVGSSALSAWPALLPPLGGSVAAEEAPSAAEPAISQEKALEIFRTFFRLDNLNAWNVHVNLEQNFHNGHTVWTVFAHERDQPRPRSFTAGIDAMTGTIVHFHRDEERGAFAFPPRVTRDEARAIAADFVRRHFGDPNYHPFEDPVGPTPTLLRRPYETYAFTLVKEVNGIPFVNASVTVNVNGQGDVVSMWSQPMPKTITFDPAEGTLSPEALRAKLAATLPMKLALASISEAKEPKWALIYEPAYSLHTLDARTGEPLGPDLNPIQPPENKPVADKPLAPPPQKRVQRLTREEALHRLRQAFSLPGDIQVVNSRLDRETGSEVWTFDFQYRTATGGVGWSGGRVDAWTGRIVGFSISPYLEARAEWMSQDGSPPPEVTVTLERAREAAIAWVKKHVPDLADQLVLTWARPAEAHPLVPRYSFFFQRQWNGIAVADQGVHLTLSATTGELLDFWLTWHNMPSVKADKVLTPDEARQRYLRHVALTRVYMLPDTGISSTGVPQTARLIYRAGLDLTEPVALDAVTGTWIDLRTGAPYRKPDHQTNDIAGHWAEKELRTLLELNILDSKDGKVRPDDVASRGEYLAMLIAAVSDGGYVGIPGPIEQPVYHDVPRDHPHFRAIQTAYALGLLPKTETLSPDAPITREEAAVFLVKALGYEKIAEHKALFLLPFSDKSALREPGYVAIAHGIGLINGRHDGRFAPHEPLTRAEAAVSIYRFLEKRPEYQVNPPFGRG